jgi:ABC-type uncharacterized transport system permease subunit
MEMPDSFLYFITAGAWLGLTGLAWRATRPVVAAGPSSTSEIRLESVLVPVALVLHAMLLYRGIVVAEGLNLGLANAISLLVWLTALIYWLAGLAYRGIAGMQSLMAPIGLGAVVLQLTLPSRHVVTYTAEPLFTMHFAIAMLAYALVIVATVHALVMLAEEKWLHRGVLPPFLKALPPLMEMEALLFRIVLAVFILLTLTVVSGVFFSELLFGKPFTFTHKNVFAILSWLIFGGLLAGHYLRGWRGKKAVRWTLAGFFMLLLAYVGSKFVLEIILRR